jgi:hypothetical protein
MCPRACSEAIVELSQQGSQDVVSCRLVDDVTSQYALR